MLPIGVSMLLTAVLSHGTSAQASSTEAIGECAAVVVTSPATAPNTSDPLEAAAAKGATGNGPGGNALTRHAEWYVAAADAADLASEPGTVLIDIRRPERFAQRRVAGSLNITGHQIKTKAFLRGKWLLLLSDGYAFRELERTVGDLQAEGFADVAIVEGGLPGWQESAGSLPGVPDADQLQTITAADYLEEQRYDHWKVAFYGANEAAQDQAVLRIDTVLAPDLGPDAIRARLTEMASGERGTLKPLVLMTSERGEGYQRIQSMLEVAGVWNLFYLEGGVQGYRRHLAQMQAMHHRDPFRSGKNRPGYPTRE